MCWNLNLKIVNLFISTLESKDIRGSKVFYFYQPPFRQAGISQQKKIVEHNVHPFDLSYLRVPSPWRRLDRARASSVT